MLVLNQTCQERWWVVRYDGYSPGLLFLSLSFFLSFLLSNSATAVPLMMMMMMIIMPPPVACSGSSVSGPMAHVSCLLLPLLFPFFFYLFWFGPSASDANANYKFNSVWGLVLVLVLISGSAGVSYISSLRVVEGRETAARIIHPSIHHHLERCITSHRIASRRMASHHITSTTYITHLRYCCCCCYCCCLLPILPFPHSLFHVPIPIPIPILGFYFPCHFSPCRSCASSRVINVPFRCVTTTVPPPVFSFHPFFYLHTYIHTSSTAAVRTAAEIDWIDWIGCFLHHHPLPPSPLQPSSTTLLLLHLPPLFSPHHPSPLTPLHGWLAGSRSTSTT